MTEQELKDTFDGITPRPDGSWSYEELKELANQNWVGAILCRDLPHLFTRSNQNKKQMQPGYVRIVGTQYVFCPSEGSISRKYLRFEVKDILEDPNVQEKVKDRIIFHITLFRRYG